MIAGETKHFKDLSEEEAKVRMRQLAREAVSSYRIENVEIDEDNIYNKLITRWRAKYLKKSLLEKSA